MIDSHYKKLLINRKSPIAKEKQLEIIDNLFDCFVQYNKDLLYISGGFLGRVTSRKAFEVTAYQHIMENFKDVEIKTFDEEKKREKWNMKIADIYDTLTVRNSFDLLTYESDLFAQSQTVSKDNITKTITVTTNKLHIKEIPILNMSESDYYEIVQDYKKHFKYFDELLKLIIDMRLAKDRKASFVHLRVKSNWGKSFLSGLLQNLQIGFEIDYHNLMNKGANDIAPIQVRNSFVMILDEFNNFSSEMKKLSHDFKFAPKFGMTEKVELYLKLLMSAEKSPSFSGGVDDQIVNRVMVMDIDDKEAGRLTDREIYIKHGNAKYMSALERYSYLMLTKHLNGYLALEKFEAHKKADEAVNLALKKYKMKNVTNLNNETKSVLNEAIFDIVNSTNMDISPRFRDIKSNIVTIENGVYAGKIFIKQPKRTIETILKNTVSDGDYKKMKWKLSNLSDILTIVFDGSVRVNGEESKKGIVITTEEPKTHKEIINDLRDSGNLIMDDDNQISNKELF
jgi:hypothetical protein